MNSLASAILSQFDALVEDYDRRLQSHSAYAAMPAPIRREAARRTLHFVAEWLQSGDDTHLIQFLKMTAQERVAQGLDIEIMQYAVDVLGTVLEPLIVDVDTARLIWRTFFKAQGIIAREAAERQQVVEDALREAEERFRAIYEESNDAIMLLAPEGFSDCNQQTLTLFGFETKEEFTAVHPAQVSPPFQPDGQDSMAAAQERIETAYRQGYNRFEWVHRRTDGVDFPAEVLLSAFVLGGKRVLQATVRDISEHKRLEQQIQESLERRERQVQTSTEVAQEIAAAPALEELFQRVVTLIKERFGYYHAQIFRHEPALDAVVLVTGYGEAGQKMLAAGHKLAMGRGVVGTAAATGQSILAIDVAQDKDWRPNPNLPDTQGELAVPIKLRDEVLGILDVQSETAGALTADDQLLLEGLCGQIAIAIDNVRLFEETQRRVDELATLNEIGREFAATLTIEETCQAVYRQVDRLFKADNFVIGAYQEGSREWVQLFEMRDGQPGEVGLRRMGRDLISFILSTRQPVLLRDVEENERFHLEQSLQSAGPTAASWMGAPLLAGGAVAGIMTIQENERARVYDEQHLMLFSTIASQAAIAFQNARLFERARRHAEETAALNELSRKLSARLDVSQVLEEVYRGVSQLLTVASFYIGLHDAERNEVTFPINVTESVVDRQITGMPADQGLTGYIIQTGESLLIQSNVTEWLKRKGMESVGEPAQSWLGVPMMVGDQVLGVMAVQDHRRPNVYDEYDRDLLESIAAQATIAIQNARLFEETQATLAETQALLRLSSSIISFENLSHLLQTVADNVAALLPADRISLKSFDLEKRALTHFVKGGPGSSHILTDTKFDEFWEGLSGWALRERKPALSPKDVPDPRESPVAQQKRRETDCGAVLVAPLIYRDHVLGTMTAINRPDQPNFTQKNVDLMVAMANQAAAAMENARLFEETQNALNEVQQSEDLMRTLIDATPDWIFIKDREHRYRLANQGYADALHLRPEDFIGKDDLELGFPEELVKGNPDKDIRGFWADDQLVLDTGEAQVYPNDPATIDGEVRTFHTIKTPLRDADGHTWGVLAFSRDVTELEQTAEALRRREAQMQETLDELERLNRAATREGWQSFLQTGQLASAYRYDQSTIQPAQDLWMPQIEQAIQQNVLVPSGKENEAAVAPLSVRGTVIGALGVYDDPQRPLSPDELALLQEILEQGALALENARLYQDAQRRAARERMIGEVTGRIRETLELEDVLKTAVREMRQALGADELGARLLLLDQPEPDSD